MGLSRRAFLGTAAAAAGAGGPALAMRPRPRPAGLLPPAPQGPGAAVLARYSLSSVTGASLRDLSTGRALEVHREGAPIPPASVTKVPTALYALSTLGPDHRFHTLLAIDGVVEGGTLQGDLYLVGGGDPHLDTDGLAKLSGALQAAGIRRVAGAFRIIDGALPYHAQIDPTQPVYASYNPAISGLNLNFNRVRFGWRPGDGGPALRMSARSAGFDPEVRHARVELSDRRAPVFDYQGGGDGPETWTVARGALRGEGARWLPVRAPARYAGEVFRILAGEAGVTLPGPQPGAPLPPELRTIGVQESAPLSAILKAMLRYSTNLTAEVVGLAASQAQGHWPDSIAASAAAMTAWLRATHGMGAGAFVNHSGLSDRTRVSAHEVVQMLDIAATGPLPGLLDEEPLADAPKGVRAIAKTGTLHFARSLAGYLEARDGRRLAFAILSADLDKRAAAGAQDPPPGARRWLGSARAQERELLSAWANAYLG